RLLAEDASLAAVCVSHLDALIQAWTAGLAIREREPVAGGRPVERDVSRACRDTRHLATRIANRQHRRAATQARVREFGSRGRPRRRAEHARRIVEAFLLSVAWAEVQHSDPGVRTRIGAGTDVYGDRISVRRPGPVQRLAYQQFERPSRATRVEQVQRQ